MLAELPPRPFLFNPHQELFRRQTGLVFDAVAPATAAASFTLEYLFDPARSARMVEQKALDPSLPGLHGRDRAGAPGRPSAPRPRDGYEAAVKRAVEQVFVDRLMALAGSAPMPQVRAEAQYELEQLGRAARPGVRTAPSRRTGRTTGCSPPRSVGSSTRPHAPVAEPGAPDMPPGDPIGDPGMDWLGGLRRSAPPAPRRARRRST